MNDEMMDMLRRIMVACEKLASVQSHDARRDPAAAQLPLEDYKDATRELMQRVRFRIADALARSGVPNAGLIGFRYVLRGAEVDGLRWDSPSWSRKMEQILHATDRDILALALAGGGKNKSARLRQIGDAIRRIDAATEGTA